MYIVEGFYRKNSGARTLLAREKKGEKKGAGTSFLVGKDGFLPCGFVDYLFFPRGTETAHLTGHLTGVGQTMPDSSVRVVFLGAGRGVE